MLIVEPLAGVAVAVILLLVALASFIRDFGWGAAIAAPLVGIFWTVLAGFTSAGSYMSRFRAIGGIPGASRTIPVGR